MKTLMALFLSFAGANLIAQSASADILVSDLKACSYSGGAITDWDLGATYIFNSDKIYQIDLPKSGEFRSLPETAFPTLKGQCYSQKVGGPAVNLGPAETSECQTAVKSFSLIDGKKLKGVVKAIVATTYERSQELAAAFYSDDAKDKKFARANLEAFGEALRACESLGKLDAASMKSLGEMRMSLSNITKEASTKSNHVTRSSGSSQ